MNTETKVPEEQTREILEETRTRIRLYIPDLFVAMFKTWVLGLASFLITHYGARFFYTQLLGVDLSPFTNIAILVLSAMVFYQVLRGAEKRFMGTGLFLLYTSMSRDRRTVEALLNNPPDNPETLQQAFQRFQASAEQFMDGMHTAGIEPKEKP